MQSISVHVLPDIKPFKSPCNAIGISASGTADIPQSCPILSLKASKDIGMMSGNLISAHGRLLVSGGVAVPHMISKDVFYQLPHHFQCIHPILKVCLASVAIVVNAPYLSNSPKQEMPKQNN